MKGEEEAEAEKDAPASVCPAREVYVLLHPKMRVSRNARAQW